MSKYVWKDGFRLSGKADANIVGRRLQYLMKRHGDILTPDLIVEDAKPLNSVLHNLFEWNNTAAAIKYRERQARDLLVSVRVIIEGDDEEAEPYRAFVNVITEESGSVYVDAIKAVCIDEYREHLLARAIREISAWISRYNQLQELAELQKAVVVVKRLLLKVQIMKVGV